MEHVSVANTKRVNNDPSRATCQMCGVRESNSCLLLGRQAFYH